MVEATPADRAVCALGEVPPHVNEWHKRLGAAPFDGAATAGATENFMQIEALRPMTSARLAVIGINATLRVAASTLCDHRIGLVVVCDEGSKARGVVSKSDIVRHLADVGAANAPIATLMSRNIVSCRPEDDLHATWQNMAAQNLQNIPVLSADSKPLGVLDIRDALKSLFEQEEYQEGLLVNYIAGVGYQ